MQTGYRPPGWRPARGTRGIETGGSHGAAAPRIVLRAPSTPPRRARGACGRGARRPRAGRRLGRARRGRRAARALARVPQALLADGQLHLRRGPQLPAQRRALADMQQTSDLCSASIRLG